MSEPVREIVLENESELKIVAAQEEKIPMAWHGALVKILLWAEAAVHLVQAAMILLGKAPFDGAATLYPLLAVLICGAGILAFQKGMKVYAKYGSQRYKNMGHRS